MYLLSIYECLYAIRWLILNLNIVNFLKSSEFHITKNDIFFI